MTNLILQNLTTQLIADYQNAKAAMVAAYPNLEADYQTYRNATQAMLDSLELVELYGLQQQAGVQYFNVWD